MSRWTAGRLADRVGARCEGDPDLPLRGVGSLHDAAPDELSFCTGGRWLPALQNTRAGAVLLDQGEAPDGLTVLRHPDPRRAFALAASLLHPEHWPAPGVHPAAWVAEDAQVEGATIDAFAVVETGAVVEPGAWVGAHAYVGRGAVVGPGSRLMPHAVVMDGVRLGARVRLLPGAVIGADGFGQVAGDDGITRMPQLGTVVLEDDVEVGALSCVDRAALGETRVGRGSRLDNLVQVAHGVRIGADCLLAAFAGVAGGAVLGDRVILAGRSSVVDGVEVGEGAVLAGLASATRRVPAGERIGGAPGRPLRRWLRELAALRELPRALRTLRRLERASGRVDGPPNSLEG